MGIGISKGPDPNVRKGIEKLQKNKMRDLLISSIVSGVVGAVIGYLLGVFS